MKKEGLKRLLWEAEANYYKFGIPQLPSEVFYKWQKANHACWKLYWKVFNPTIKRIGYL